MGDSSQIKKIPDADQSSRRDPAEVLCQLWQEGQQPDLQAFLKQAGRLTPNQLAAVVKVDQEARWQRGEPVPVETYLDLDSCLRKEEEVLELIYREYILRVELGETPGVEEYLRRFPRYADQLQSLLLPRETVFHDLPVTPQAEACDSRKLPRETVFHDLPVTPQAEACDYSRKLPQETVFHDLPVSAGTKAPAPLSPATQSAVALESPRQTGEHPALKTQEMDIGEPKTTPAASPLGIFPQETVALEPAAAPAPKEKKAPPRPADKATGRIATGKPGPHLEKTILPDDKLTEILEPPTAKERGTSDRRPRATQKTPSVPTGAFPQETIDLEPSAPATRARETSAPPPLKEPGRKQADIFHQETVDFEPASPPAAPEGKGSPRPAAKDSARKQAEDTASLLQQTILPQEKITEIIDKEASKPAHLLQQTILPQEKITEVIEAGTPSAGQLLQQTILPQGKITEVIEEALSPRTVVSDAGSSTPTLPPGSQEDASVQLQVGNYEVLSELGRGGMGVVYKARDVRLKRLVALKMVLSGVHAGAQDLARFRAEAEAVAHIQHPNIVQIYEVSEHDGRPFFSLEFVDGGSLSDKLDGTPQPPRQAAQMIETLARAIHVAHQRGVVHRDLKPANVLMTKESTLKITDFGLAKRLDDDSGQTRSGAIMGTPSYMAPEQAGGRIHEIGPLTDVYSLGAILYEMLAGRPPFRAASVIDTLEQVCFQDPLPPSRLQPKLPRDLETICLRCLQKEPRQRYPSAEALADDLQRFLAGDAILARPTPAWERAWKWAKRRPAVVALIAVCCLALVSMVGMIVWNNAKLHVRLNEARAEVVESRRDKLRAEAQALLSEGQTFFEKQKMLEAHERFSDAFKKIESELDLDDLKKMADAKIKEVMPFLNKEKEYRAAQDELKRFNQFYDDAFFHKTLITGASETANRKHTEEAAHEALARFGPALEPKAFPKPRPESVSRENYDGFFKEIERDRIRERYYETLFALAEAQTSAQESLKVLDRAAKLGIPTRAYYALKARYLADLKKSAEAQAARLEEVKKNAEAQAARKDADKFDADAQSALKEADKIELKTALDYFLTGEDHYKQGDLKNAISKFESALRLQTDHFWAQYLLAICYLRAHQPAQAKLALNACLSLRPDFVWNYLMRGFAYSELGGQKSSSAGQESAKDFLDAAADFQKASELVAARRKKLDEDKENKRVSAAEADDIQKDLDHARYSYLVYRGVMHYRRKAMADAGLEQARLELDKAEANFQKARKDADRDKAKKQLDAAQAHRHKAGEVSEKATVFLAEAEKDLVEAVALNKEQYQAYVNLAQVYQKLGKPKEARDNFDRAIAKESALPSLYRGRAKVHLQLGNRDKALEDYQKALKHKKNSTPEEVADDHVEIGRIWQAKKDHRQARESYQEAIDVHSELALAFRCLAESFMEEKDYKKAIENFNEYLARTKEPEAGVYQGRGLAKAKLGEYGAAVDDYSTALVKKKDTYTYSARGWAQVALGNLNAAGKDFDQAIALDKDRKNGYAYSGRGYIRAKDGVSRHEDAVKDAKASIELEPRSPGILHNAARTYSLAMKKLDAQTKQESKLSTDQRKEYEQEGLDSIRKSLEALEPEKKGATAQRKLFWQEYIKKDADLKTLQRSPGYVQLEAEYVGTTKPGNGIKR